MTTADRLNVIPLGEAMFTQRAIRRFRTQSRMRYWKTSRRRSGPTGANQQWHFILVKDDDKRRNLELYTGRRRDGAGRRARCGRRCGWPTRSATRR